VKDNLRWARKGLSEAWRWWGIKP